MLQIYPPTHPNPTPPAPSTDPALILREDNNNLVDAYNKLVQNASVREDGLRAVKSA